VYFHPWLPWGYLQTGVVTYDNVDYPTYGVECADDAQGYQNGGHPPMGTFWGWQPYYNLLRNVFQSN
jgi:hypothetical protein